MPKNIEFLNIVDANNNIIGQASRQEIHEQKLRHRAVHIFIRYQDVIFLQLRSSHKNSFPNKWDSSAAGHLLAGEDYIVAAQRELAEELGINLPRELFREVGEMWASEENGLEFVKIYYIELQQLPELFLCADEITSGGWFAINHINHWLNQQPQDFAGCFAEIWQSFRTTL